MAVRNLHVTLFVLVVGLVCSYGFIPFTGLRVRRNRGLQMVNLFNINKGAPAKKASKTFTITVKQPYYKDAQLTVEGGAPVNLRKELMKQKIDIYPLQGKIYNCGGGGQCGTCAVQIISGAENANPKGPNEKNVLGPKKGDDIRLSCCTRVTGDVTVRVKP